MKTYNLLEKIDEILLKKSLNRDWLSAKMGSSKQNIVTVLRTGDPKISFCIKLSKVLNVSIFKLFEFENNEGENTTPTDGNNEMLFRKLDKIIELLEKK